MQTQAKYIAFDTRIIVTECLMKETWRPNTPIHLQASASNSPSATYDRNTNDLKFCPVTWA